MPCFLKRLEHMSQTSMAQDKVQSLQLSVEAKCCFFLPSDPGDKFRRIPVIQSLESYEFLPRSYPTKQQGVTIRVYAVPNHLFFHKKSDHQAVVSSGVRRTDFLKWP